MPFGNGSFVLHKMLEAKIPGYRVHGYDPRLTFIPPILSLVGRSERAYLIHTTPDHGLFFKRRRIPLIITVHHLVLDSYMRKQATLPRRIHYATDLRWFTIASLKMASRVTTVSRFTADMVQKELNYQSPVKVIHNGIDTDRFIPSKKTHVKGIKVLFSGNPSRRKGFHWIPAIAGRLRNGVSISYTGGLRRSPVLLKAKNLKALGQIPSKDMPLIYQTHDILVSPIVREGFGLAIAEAMSCGLPVVASNCSSIPELIDHGKGGYLCPVGDVAAFAEKINHLAESPRLRREMGEYNRAKVERMFTLERMVKEYVNLFEEVLEQ
ncbi:MAG TPA: glycosyltransferase family 1 protein [Desulfobacteraceae bacterium]|nr:glycosyltransferase family 1 protein [Desulfobacteraceae bacterium]